jgi:hypothetical protein
VRRRALLGGMAAAAGLGLLGCRPGAEGAAGPPLALRIVCDPWAR